MGRREFLEAKRKTLNKGNSEKKHDFFGFHVNFRVIAWHIRIWNDICIIYLSGGAKKSHQQAARTLQKNLFLMKICICTKFVRNTCAGERVEGSLTVHNEDVKIPTERGFSAEPKHPTPPTGAP